MRKFPLMTNNIGRDDLDKVISFLKKNDPILTQSSFVKKFENKWSKWLGVKYSVFVNSGSSSNLISLSILRDRFGTGEIIVPALTWVSDIASVIQCGFKPIFVDVNMNNLSMNVDSVLKKITKNTKAVFITHAQGFNGLNNKLLSTLKKKNIPLIEDVCESHGASFKNKKLGNYGLISNFSFYYAHHMSTIEGGMVCTNDYDIYNQAKLYRSHGLLREIDDIKVKTRMIKKYKDLNPEFIFLKSAYNLRNTEIPAIIGLNQINKLNANIKKRNTNHVFFLERLNQDKYFTNFDLLGASNYAFNLILKNKDKKYLKKLINKLREKKIEFRLGSAGGGNQMRQPYVKDYLGKANFNNFPNVEHIHFYGMYIGNYPSLPKDDLEYIIKTINL